MTLQQVIWLAINLSMAITVLGVGLNANWTPDTYLLRNPGLLIRSILSMNVVMPVLAAIVLSFLDLDPATKIAIVALALSPVPPNLPNKQTKAGGTAAYVVGLLAATAVCSIVIVPLSMALIGLIFGRDLHVPAGTVALIALTGILLPLAIGLFVRHFAPEVAERIAKSVSLAGSILLVAAFLPVLFQIWPSLVAMVGNGTLIMLALFTIVGVAVGHTLGGPADDSRTVLALATGTRHPGVALAIAGANFADVKEVLAVVLWHLIVGAIVSGPYVNWRKRVHASLRAGGMP